MLVSEGQLNSLCRFNRNYAVKQLELDTTEEDGFTTLHVHAVLKAGATEIRKGFSLDQTGNLLGVMVNESGAANTENPA